VPAATTAHAALRAVAALVVADLAFSIEAVFSLKDVVASYERLKSALPNTDAASFGERS
jgi:hypothetical protein